MTLKTEAITPDLLLFGRRLKAMRVKIGVSSRHIGRETGITSGHMSHLESGKSCPSSQKLERLADVFGVTMDELWRGVGRCEGL